MHILIVNSSSFKMTLSSSLCKHFHIQAKLMQRIKELSVRPLSTDCSFLNMHVHGSKFMLVLRVTCCIFAMHIEGRS